MADATIQERMKRYASRQKERGISKLTIWVPVEDVEKIKHIASKMRDAHKKKVDWDGSEVAELVLTNPETGEKVSLGSVTVKDSDYDG